MCYVRLAGGTHLSLPDLPPLGEAEVDTPSRKDWHTASDVRSSWASPERRYSVLRTILCVFVMLNGLHREHALALLALSGVADCGNTRTKYRLS